MISANKHDTFRVLDAKPFAITFARGEAIFPVLECPCERPARTAFRVRSVNYIKPSNLPTSSMETETCEEGEAGNHRSGNGHTVASVLEGLERLRGWGGLWEEPETLENSSTAPSPALEKKAVLLPGGPTLPSASSDCAAATIPAATRAPGVATRACGRTCSRSARTIHGCWSASHARGRRKGAGSSRPAISARGSGEMLAASSKADGECAKWLASSGIIPVRSTTAMIPRDQRSHACQRRPVSSDGSPEMMMEVMVMTTTKAGLRSPLQTPGAPRGHCSWQNRRVHAPTRDLSARAQPRQSRSAPLATADLARPNTSFRAWGLGAPRPDCATNPAQLASGAPTYQRCLPTRAQARCWGARTTPHPRERRWGNKGRRSLGPRSCDQGAVCVCEEIPDIPETG